MLTRAFLAAAACLLPTGAGRGQQPADFDPAAVAELRKLSGKWVATAGEVGGKAMSKEALAKAMFATTGFDLPPFGPRFINVYPTARQFLFTDGGIGSGGMVYRGFYEVDGDTLRVCAITVPEGPFGTGLPQGFADAREKGYTVVTFTKVKAKP